MNANNIFGFPNQRIPSERWRATGYNVSGFYSYLNDTSGITATEIAEAQSWNVTGFTATNASFINLRDNPSEEESYMFITDDTSSGSSANPSMSYPLTQKELDDAWNFGTTILLDGQATNASDTSDYRGSSAFTFGWDVGSDPRVDQNEPVNYWFDKGAWGTVGFRDGNNNEISTNGYVEFDIKLRSISGGSTAFILGEVDNTEGLRITSSGELNIRNAGVTYNTGYTFPSNGNYTVKVARLDPRSDFEVTVTPEGGSPTVVNFSTSGSRSWHLPRIGFYSSSPSNTNHAISRLEIKRRYDDAVHTINFNEQGVTRFETASGSAWIDLKQDGSLGYQGYHWHRDNTTTGGTNSRVLFFTGTNNADTQGIEINASPSNLVDTNPSGEFVRYAISITPMFTSATLIKLDRTNNEPTVIGSTTNFIQDTGLSEPTLAWQSGASGATGRHQQVITLQLNTPSDSREYIIQSDGIAVNAITGIAGTEPISIVIPTEADSVEKNASFSIAIQTARTTVSLSCEDPLATIDGSNSIVINPTGSEKVNKVFVFRDNTATPAQWRTVLLHAI